MTHLLIRYPLRRCTAATRCLMYRSASSLGSPVLHNKKVYRQWTDRQSVDHEAIYFIHPDVLEAHFYHITLITPISGIRVIRGLRRMWSQLDCSNCSVVCVVKGVASVGLGADGVAKMFDVICGSGRT